MILTFFAKKIKSAKSAKNFCKINTDSLVLNFCRNNHRSMSSDDRDIRQNVIFGKFCEKKQKKNFDLE